MKFGIKTPPEHTTWAQMRDLWVAADDIEVCETAWSWDHFYPLTGDLDGANLEAWTSLAALAQATSRIRVGIQVAALLHHHPAVIANMAATIDHVSDGRLELGLGAGWNQMECDAYGIPLPPLKERFDRFDEGVEIIIGLLTQDWTDFEGEHYRITHARCEPKPVQRPHPPITIGGKGPQAHPACHRPLGPAVERDHADRRGVAGAQTRSGGALRHVRPRPLGDRVLGECHGARRRRPRSRLERIAAYQEASSDIVILNLPHAAPPSMLDPLAAAVAPLR
jgi:hypothetical protein